MPRKKLPSELVENRAAFFMFLRARLGSDDEAEEVLQAAYVKGLKSPARPRDEGSVRAWFFSVVRNALTDHYRRRAARAGAEERASREIKLSARDEEPLADLASRLGLSRNNATVRLHRARKSLKSSLLKTCGACASHGCLDCSCRK